ncbi:MAG: amidohydrolase family protein [Chloroflexi bacterium]|nr:amidohydrolase family protein [Chloroflexota bacterium]
MKYRVISTDDHLQEGPHTWTSRMSRDKWGDKIPQIRREKNGTDQWYIYGTPRSTFGVGTVHGAMPDRTKVPTRWEDVPKSTYVPAERIKAMEQDGVDVHTFFANIAGIAGNTFSDPMYDEDFRIACIRAYNDYQIEEWDKPYPGRFITLAHLPMWDVNKAVAEAKRTAKMGVKGYAFAFPQQFGYPHISDPYWDPLWATAQDSNLSINLHIGSGGSMGFKVNEPTDSRPLMFRLAESSTRTISSNTAVMSTVLFSGILERFPKLKWVSSESGMGWVPYLLEVADHQWDRQALAREKMTKKPSEYFHRQCYVNFWFEVFGAEMRHSIGIDNILWESDFPHPTCTWPESQKYIKASMQDWPEAERRKVLVENPAKLYHLPLN